MVQARSRRVGTSRCHRKNQFFFAFLLSPLTVTVFLSHIYLTSLISTYSLMSFANPEPCSQCRCADIMVNPVSTKAMVQNGSANHSKLKRSNLCVCGHTQQLHGLRRLITIPPRKCPGLRSFFLSITGQTEIAVSYF